MFRKLTTALHKLVKAGLNVQLWVFRFDTF